MLRACVVAGAHDLRQAEDYRGLCCSGKSVAEARDKHYQSTGLLVIEPEDTRQRTRNLQQTNTNGI